MTDFARLVLDADTRGLRDAEHDLDRLSGTARRSAQEVGASMQRLGVGLTATVTAPLALFGTASFNAASDAAELQSAFDQTFGEMSDSMNEWAETTGNAFGRSTQAMQELANSYGLFFNNLPIAREEAARMSQVFAELTQDFASFHNLTEDEAMTAFRSGLAGETEALRRYGIDVSAAAVETQALTMGLAAASSELTEQDKILARYQLILNATTNAQGDVLRTSEGTANQIRTASAAFEELQVAIGNKLLPALTPLISGLGSILDRFARLPDGAQTAIVAVAGLAAAAGPLLLVFGSLITMWPAIAGGFAAMGVALGPLLPIIAAVAAAGALIYMNWDKIAPVLEELRTRFVETIGPPLREFIDAASAKLTELWEGPLGDAIRWVMENLADFGLSYTSVLGSGFIRVLDAAIAAFSGVVTVIMDGLTVVSRLLEGDFSGAWRAFENLVTGVFDTVGEVIMALVPEMVQMGRDIIEGLVRGIAAAPGAVRDALTGVIQGGIDAAKDLLGIASPSRLFMEIGVFVTQGLAIGIRDGQSYVTDAMDDLARNTADQGEMVVRGFDDMGQGIVRSLQGLVGNIKNGGFFDILGGVVGLFGQIAGTGAFGQTLGNFFGGARANGGPVSAGKTYLVGERGPELFTAPGNGNIVANDNIGGTTRVEVIPSPYFDVRVNGQIERQAPAIAQGGAALARTQMAQQGRYSVNR